MWPDRVSNPGPPTYESGALPIALRSPARGLCSIGLNNLTKCLRFPCHCLSPIEDSFTLNLEKAVFCKPVDKLCKPISY